MLWQAFTMDQPSGLLIDEVDKADIEFPNDLLRELDRMEFYVYETRELVEAKNRPIVFITSNNEKEWPDAFLRRCFFHYIRFPRRGDHARDRGGAFPRHQAAPGIRGAQAVLRNPRGSGDEEEAVDLGASRLAQALAGRGYRPRDVARARSEEAHSAAAWRAPKERAGRAPVRAARLSRTSGGAMKFWA